MKRWPEEIWVEHLKDGRLIVHSTVKPPDGVPPKRRNATFRRWLKAQLWREQHRLPDILEAHWSISESDDAGALEPVTSAQAAMILYDVTVETMQRKKMWRLHPTYIEWLHEMFTVYYPPRRRLADTLSRWKKRYRHRRGKR